MSISSIEARRRAVLKLEAELLHLKETVQRKQEELKLENDKLIAELEFEVAKKKLDDVKNETVQSRKAREQQEAKAKHEQIIRDNARARKEESERPPYWPMPRANMSREEQNEWYENHGY